MNKKHIPELNKVKLFLIEFKSLPFELKKV
jgi:hypothetical protein